ncbi:MAG: hypothetical protein RSB76_03325 [Clostridia bacterium]
MILKDLTKGWISEYTIIDEHGEKSKEWHYKSIAWLNLQQDLNELDKKTSGEVDYSIYKARTDKNHNIKNGDGISFIDISKEINIFPEYRVLDQNKIGTATTYRLEKYND